MKYPGDTADPKDVAHWMAQVAEGEYSLPGILPVMTSCVELTDAWTGPGDVRDVPGYLNNVDHDSYGYFQQRPSQGWGSWSQVTDADYALRKFCLTAASLEDWEWNRNTHDADTLGRWCQAVQISAYPNAYRDKGFPMAQALLGENAAAPPNVGFDSEGWVYEVETDAYLKSDRKDATLQTNADGWVWGAPTQEVEPEPAPFAWPEANDAPIPSSPWYGERCPTRYTWRSDVEEWARYLVQNYDVWCNTYHHHPEEVWYRHGISREADSLDVWGPAGRGDPIDPAVGDEIFDLLFYYEGKPDIEWIIWKEVMYGAWNGWQGEEFGDGSDFTAHRDHVHCTFL